MLESLGGSEAATVEVNPKAWRPASAGVCGTVSQVFNPQGFRTNLRSSILFDPREPAWCRAGVGVAEKAGKGGRW